MYLMMKSFKDEYTLETKRVIPYEYEIKTLIYYWSDGSFTSFNSYTIDTNAIIRRKDTGIVRQIIKGGGKKQYDRCTIRDDESKQRNVYVSRAMLSTFVGPPPTKEHTADHIISDQTSNNKLENLRWLNKSGQRLNQLRPETYKSAFIIIKDDKEMTAKQWVEYFKQQKTHKQQNYTASMITSYAMKKIQGFSYKIYPDLLGEVWKKVDGSKTSKGYWKVSNINRVKYVTSHAEHVFVYDNPKEYPSIQVNKKQIKIHNVVFMTFFPELWKNRKSTDKVLHEKDNCLDFRPHTLSLGSQQKNGHDAHENKKYDGKITERKSIVMYSKNIERLIDFKSQREAARYILACKLNIKEQEVDNKSTEYIVIRNNIRKQTDKICKNGQPRIAYDHIWKSY